MGPNEGLLSMLGVNATSKEREDILKRAAECVCNDRNAQYGEPEDSFSIIAKYWSLYLERDVDAYDVGMLMTLFKIARLQTGGYKTDSVVDACGYLACVGEIGEKNLAKNR